MEESYTISKDLNLLKSMDFDQLKQEGISLLQQFSGNIWTDYNDHDPGVTLLEQLCFSLTDVSYRRGFGIEEILYAGKEKQTDDDKQEPPDTFFPAHEILPSHPITLKDYRKLLIDQVNDVKNVWIEPELDLIHEKKGIYKVYLQVEEGVEEKEWPRINREVTQKLHQFRNLGEDFGKIEILSYEEITVGATIELKYNALGEEVLGKLIADLEAYLTPHVKKYALQELLAEGVSIEKIMDGPLLYNGFIKDEDLLPRTQLIRKSKFIEIITSIDGAEKVSRFELLKNGITFLGDILTIPEDKIPRLFDYLNPKRDKFTSYIRFTKGGKPYTINPNLVNQIYASQSEKFQKTFIKQTDLSILPALESKKPESQQLNLKEYFSLQRFLPAIYGVGEYGLSREEGPERVARAKQLKAYLLFFDQLLANYLSQLTSLRTLFSLYDETSEYEELQRSYFSQPAFDVPEIETVLLRDNTKESFLDAIEVHIGDIERIFKSRQIRFAWKRELNNFEVRATSRGFNTALEAYCRALFNSVTTKLSSPTDEAQIALKNKLQKEILAFKMACIRTVFRANLDRLMRDIDPYLTRRNQFLDHLLARFGETSLGVHPTFLTKGTGGDFNKSLITSKLNVLKDYPRLSHNRSRGPVFLGKENGVEVSGLQWKLGASLKFNASHRRLASFLQPAGEQRAKLKFSKTKPKKEPQKTPNHFTFSLPPQNKSELLAILVSEGLHDYNYEIVKVDPGERVGAGNYEIRFRHPLFVKQPDDSDSPSDQVEYLTINRTRTRKEAEEALAALIKYFNKLNLEGEGCHLVEHLLLRQLSPNPELFEILDDKGDVILKSFKPRPREEQNFIASNIVLYATREIPLMKYDKEGRYEVLFWDGDKFKIRTFEWVLMQEDGETQGEEIACLIKDSVDLFGEIIANYRLKNQSHDTPTYSGRSSRTSRSAQPEWVLKEVDQFGNATIVDGKKFIEELTEWIQGNEEEGQEEIHLFDGKTSNFSVKLRQDGKFEVILSGENESGKRDDVGRFRQSFDTENEAIRRLDKVILEFIEMRMQNKLISRLQMKTEKVETEPPEFYSQQCSLVFPNWPARFQRPEFKTHLEQLVHRNAPAHLKFNFIWLDPEEMKDFEDVYEHWHHLKYKSVKAEISKKGKILIELDKAARELATSLKQHVDGG